MKNDKLDDHLNRNFELAVKLKKSEELANELRKEVESLRIKEKELGELQGRYSAGVQTIGRGSIRMSIDALRSPRRDSRSSVISDDFEPIELRMRLRDAEQKNQKLEQTLAQLSDHNSIRNIGNELEMKYKSLIESLESKLRESKGYQSNSQSFYSVEHNNLNLIEKSILKKELSSQDEKIVFLKEEIANANALLGSVLAQTVGEASGTLFNILGFHK